MPRLLVLALLAVLALTPPPQAFAQPAPEAPAAARTALETRADQVVALLNASVEPADIFTDGFRAAVADDQIRALSASFTAQFGRAVEVALLNPRDGTRAALEIRFERGLAKGGLAISPSEDNRINELRFTSIDAVAVAGDTPAAIAADLAALPGEVNALFAPLGGTSVISRNADTRLALGSTFKLYVLAALAEDVKAGRRKWTDVVPLTEKSYPSGQLQNWPEGSPVTLHTLASLMISISDNTATDQLIAVLGKPRILKLMKDSGHSDPGANDPFLTTKQLFILKASDAPTIADWRSGDPRKQNAIEVVQAAEADPSLDTINAAFANGPKALDIEWFASPADLAKLFAYMRKTADPKVFDIMAINPSATDAIKANWRYIGYKGGSEPGVLNLTWLLTDKQGRDWVLTLGWNNAAAVVDEGKLEAIAQRILLLPR
ncbi:serine hydrolase [Erythrobacter sp. BLCC-B19]|uniref:serine hydrolase n=1 Tax=Erythrobacter sp. BLCC-B19 TaxID=3025315 RepID=UPI002361361A|nr:serine hydrolase [Erythrobacter sp. BLCC-B19]WDA40644.1 serine hydrolase [Erythrobacter sp. BLCC-B19]